MDKYVKINEMTNDILKDVQYDNVIIKDYDLAVIQQINLVLNFYNEEVEGIEKLFADENNFSDNLLMKIDPDISIDYIEKLSYNAIIKKCIVELEFILNLGFTAYSATIFRILSDLLQQFKDMKK